MTQSHSPKVVLIGWDAADWKIADPLIDAGKMPNLKRLIEAGTRSDVSTLAPALSPILWTSIATGKRPFRHGILGFVEPDPRTPHGIRPVSSRSRTTRAIWNILQLSGMRSNVTGWWPSWPAEPISGTIVSDVFVDPPPPGDNSWPAPSAAVHPTRLLEKLKELRLHPEELDQSVLEMFIPAIKKLNPNHPLLSDLAASIAEAVTVQTIATTLLQLEPATLNAVYFNAIDQICHRFIQFQPPRAAWVSAEDFELFSSVVEATYRFHDLMLGYIMHLAGPEALIILVSDHGFISGEQRINPSLAAANPASEHRKQGMFVISGPGVRRGETLRGASILDITPTILHALNLPIGADMDGTPLLNAFSHPLPIQTIPSWDLLTGEDGSLPPEDSLHPEEQRAAIDRLVALGYIAAPSGEQRQNLERSIQERDYNLAISWIDVGNHANAATILRSLVQTAPQDHRFRTHLVEVLQSLGHTEESAALLKLQQADSAKVPDSTCTSTLIPYLEAGQLLAENRPAEARDLLSRTLAQSPGNPHLLLRLGAAQLLLGDFPAATDAFRQALVADPENVHALLGLARCMLVRQNPGQALNYALDAIEIQHNTPDAHYLLAIALFRLRRPLEAAEALKMTIALDPKHVPALRRLAVFAERRLQNPQLASNCRQQAEHALRSKQTALTQKLQPEILRPVRRFAVSNSRPAHEQFPFRKESLSRPLSESIVVVSGLPRSGTSMMMQILAAGGVPIVTDEFRAADGNNPAGYYEDQRVTRLHLDKSWVPSIKGQAVKIIAPLVQHLPVIDGLHYGVILMLRDVHEIIRSQQNMLARLGKEPATFAAEKIAASWQHQLDNLRELLAARSIPVLPLEYKHCLLDPQGTAMAIRNFINEPLNIAAMKQAIQPSLNRETSLKMVSLHN
jgi:predicted AlkP superfamily phosphohydrolase/phosphomutase/tetratricopeptide (TPR) repeat protein